MLGLSLESNPGLSIADCSLETSDVWVVGDVPSVCGFGVQVPSGDGVIFSRSVILSGIREMAMHVFDSSHILRASPMTLSRHL